MSFYISTIYKKILPLKEKMCYNFNKAEKQPAFILFYHKNVCGIV